MSTLVLLSFQLWNSIFKPFGKNLEKKYSYLEMAEFDHLVKSKLLKTKTISFTQISDLNKVQFYDSQGTVILILYESREENENSINIKKNEIAKSNIVINLRVVFFNNAVDEFVIRRDIRVLDIDNQFN